MINYQHPGMCRKQKSPPKRAFLFCWLGYEDSNLGMVESESTALPLGDTPKVRSRKQTSLSWLGYEDSNLGMVESESTALPLGDTPTNLFQV
ncbi:hypothetical protein EMIT091MI3_30217 [Kosakonia quasisacchari]